MTKQIAQVFESLAKLAQERCVESMETLKLPRQTQEQLVQALRSSNIQTEHQMVFVSVIMQLMAKNRDADPLIFNQFVREFQAFSNHIPHHIQGEATVSGFLLATYNTLEDEGRYKPDNIPAYMTLTLNAHLEIDEWMRILIKTGESELRNTSSKHSPSENLSREYTSIAHHILDWYLMVSPYNAYRKTPQQLAALAYGMVNKINHALGRITPFINAQLANLGGWKSAGSFSTSLSGPFYTVIYSVKDIHLLFLDPTKLPKSWQKLIQNIAPAIGKEILGSN